jgi:hypothetical protein
MVPELPRRSRNEPIDWSELARADCTVPETIVDIEQLGKSILDRKRDFWIVVLTARRLEAMPALAPIAVREIVGPNVPVVFLKSLFATHLATLLPPKTHVYGGAVRVYRPGVNDDPWGHPLLYDPTDDYGEEILDWLGRIFTPSIARPPKLTPEESIVVLEDELARLARARDRELRVLRTRYEASLLGERNSEPSTRHPPLAALRSRRTGREHAQEMRRLIEAQWSTYLPADRNAKYPLRPHKLSRRFLEDLQSRVGQVPIDQVAWVCALVLSRFDVRRVGLAAGPLRPSPDAPQLTRKDGSRAWWCSLRGGPLAEDGPRMVFWSCADGTVELLALGYPKDTLQPMRARA